MRLSRLFAALLALVLAASLSQSLLAPAQAAPSVGALPKHDVTVAAKEIGTSNRFIVYGKVPTLPGGKIKVLRNAGGGKFTVYKKVKVKANGKFRAPIAQVGRKRTCFKVEVPKTSQYKKTTKAVACIVSL